jgi:hypothetical protein
MLIFGKKKKQKRREREKNDIAEIERDGDRDSSFAYLTSSICRISRRTSMLLAKDA